MNKIVFSEVSVLILHAMPKVPVEVVDIIHWFTFLNRAPNPPFEEVRDALSNAMKLGMAYRTKDGDFGLTDGGYKEIHQFEKDPPVKFADGTVMPVELQRIWNLEEYLNAKVLDHAKEHYELTHQEYDEAVKALDKRWEQLR